MFKGKHANVTHSKNKLFGSKLVNPAISSLKCVLRVMLQRFHRSGPNKGKLIIEDIEWVYVAFTTFAPMEFTAF